MARNLRDFACFLEVANNFQATVFKNSQVARKCEGYRNVVDKQYPGRTPACLASSSVNQETKETHDCSSQFFLF